MKPIIPPVIPPVISPIACEMYVPHTSRSIPANAITTDSGDPITTDDGDYITTDS